MTINDQNDHDYTVLKNPVKCLE